MRPVHLAPAGVVLLVLAAIGGVAQLDRPAASASPAATTRQVAVTSVARACPPALGGGSGTVALIASPAGSAQTAQTPSPLTSRPARPN